MDLKSGDLLTLLGIIIALSAYVATIRLLGIQRASETTDLEKKQMMKQNLALLSVADVPLVCSGLLLGVYIFFETLFSVKAPPILLNVSIFGFFVGGICLIALHMRAWKKSLEEYKKSAATSLNDPPVHK